MSMTGIGHILGYDRKWGSNLEFGFSFPPKSQIPSLTPTPFMEVIRGYQAEAGIAATAILPGCDRLRKRIGKWGSNLEFGFPLPPKSQIPSSTPTPFMGSDPGLPAETGIAATAILPGCDRLQKDPVRPGRRRGLRGQTWEMVIH